jgi:hypothetical protein
MALIPYLFNAAQIFYRVGLAVVTSNWVVLLLLEHQTTDFFVRSRAFQAYYPYMAPTDASGALTIAYL